MHEVLNELYATNESLGSQLSMLERAIAEVPSKLAVLQAENDALRLENNRLLTKIANLEARLNQNSSNSSKPPSSDRPGFKHRKKKASGKKAGGQPGHKGSGRTFAPKERVDELVFVPIEGACHRCGESEVLNRKIGRCHQVWELPEMKAHLTEYALEKGRCLKCNGRRTASFPAGVSGKMLGSRAEAFVVMLTGRYSLSKRDAEDFVCQMMGLKISLGTVSHTEARVSQVLKPLHQEALSVARQATVANLDETGHQRMNKNLWTWVLSTTSCVVYKVGHRRKRRVLLALLGRNFSGTVVSDRYGAYRYLKQANHQLCWAHMLRSFQSASQGAGFLGECGEKLVKLAVSVLHLWRDHREGLLSEQELFDRSALFRSEIEQLLALYFLSEISKETPMHVQLRMWAHVFWLEPDKVWNFLRISGVEPTNNQAERDLRPLVIWRKTSFFTWSLRGDRFVERMMTLVSTCKRQGRNVLEVLHEAIRYSSLRLKPPKLILSFQPTS